MKLRDYIKSHGTTPEAFAGQLGCSVSGLNKWIYEDRTPRPDMIAKIYEETGGLVGPSDFIPVSELQLPVMAAAGA